MDPFKIRRNLLKVFIPTIWIIILPIYYVNYRGKYTCYSTENHSWLGEWCYSSYMVAVSFYLMTNAVDMVLFFVPMVGKYIETSNMRMCTILSWWTQVQLVDWFDLDNNYKIELLTNFFQLKFFHLLLSYRIFVWLSSLTLKVINFNQQQKLYPSMIFNIYILFLILWDDRNLFSTPLCLGLSFSFLFNVFYDFCMNWHSGILKILNHPA